MRQVRRIWLNVWSDTEHRHAACNAGVTLHSTAQGLVGIAAFAKHFARWLKADPGSPVVVYCPDIAEPLIKCVHPEV